MKRLAALILPALWSCVLSAEAADVRGVVELFTSQGCSSCPPADALLEDLARDDTLIALSLPVDYWDRLGWKDTFGSPAFSARQRAYASGRGDGAVYTPQAVVNGIAHSNGADRGDILSRIEGDGRLLTVPVRVARGPDAFELSVGRSAGRESAGAATLLLLPYFATRDVAIGRGENARRRITYTNIVRRIDVLGPWRGEAMTARVPLSNLTGFDGAVVLLQSGTRDAPGPILGAARLDARP